MTRTMTALLLVLASGSAIANSRTAAADERVEQTRHQLMRAQTGGDAATIADARGKYRAATAVAWGLRHPARKPGITPPTR